MKRIIISLLAIACLVLPCSQVFATPVPVPLGAGYNDPDNGQSGHQRGPVIVPELSIDEYELLFDTSCISYTLQLIDENDNVVYSTVVTSNSLVLPSTLSGEYEILLLPNTGCIYFFGTINL